jgi:hypothetical protein
VAQKIWPKNKRFVQCGIECGECLKFIATCGVAEAPLLQAFFASKKCGSMGNSAVSDFSYMPITCHHFQRFPWGPLCYSRFPFVSMVFSFCSPWRLHLATIPSNGFGFVVVRIFPFWKMVVLKFL